MAIRYNQKLDTSINRIVRNYNAKIRRLEKSAEELYLPDLTSVKLIKENATNRKELMRMLKDLELFSKRGMEKTVRFSSGVEMSRYETEKLKRNLRSAKISVSRQMKSFKDTPITIFGVKQTTPHIYDEAYINLQSQRELLNKDINKLTKKQISRLEGNIKDILYSYEEDNRYKENWIDMLEKLSYYGKLDINKVEEIQKKLGKLSPSNFTRLYRNEKSIKAIQEKYIEIVRNKGNVDEAFIHDLEETLETFYQNLDVIVEDYV